MKFAYDKTICLARCARSRARSARERALADARARSRISLRMSYIFDSTRVVEK
jgi:hypothetical protein